jgi:protein-S-isoprenylcysteine O-methyltransferase Ste14
VLFMGGPVLLGAWTPSWWRAWLFLGVVFAASLILMLAVFRGRPELLDERYGSPIQSGQPLADVAATFLIGGSFLAFLVFVGRDGARWHLLGGTPPWLAAAGLALFLAGWVVFGLVFAANDFAAAIVKRQAERGHRLVGMPLWLDSVAGVVAAAAPIGAIVVRLLVEERFLRRELPGYAEYTEKVRWRLIPGVF